MVRQIIKQAVLFGLYRILFPLQYNLHKYGKLDEHKVVFIELSFPKLTGNLHFLHQTLEKTGEYHLKNHCICRLSVGGLNYVKNVCSCLKDVAGAKYVIMSDGNRFISCIHPRKETVFIQLWHGCGAFKKFGMSTANLIFGGSREELLKYPYYRNLDIVTVSSPEVVWAYEEAMNLKKDSGIIQPVGISRTDVFFQETFMQQARELVYDTVPQAKGKKILLYAPTFRGNVGSAAAPDALDILALKKAVGDEYILLIKHHPVAKGRPAIPEEAADFAVDVTEVLNIEELLCVSDVCISDYSSLVFEYSLFERPMIFFAYDLEEYGDWRGFYYDYDELTPGPVVQTTEQIIRYLIHLDTEFDKEKVLSFKNKFMSACDGKSTDRLLELVMKRRS